jgi:hypothetical protein
MSNLSLARLIRAWAHELGRKCNRSIGDIEEILRRHLYEYFAEELRNGGRLALEVLNAFGRAQFVAGRDYPLIQMFRQSEQFISLPKEEGLDFARRERLPPYSEWSDTINAASQPSPSPGLKNASVALVREENRSVYKAAKAEGRDGPNINKLADIVQPRLDRKGFYASKNLIKKIGTEDEFKAYRRRPGRTLASEQRKKNLAADFEL